jgi:tRNA A37 threonylcarbamoyladenosine dehydratase
MNNQYERTMRLIGAEGLGILRRSKVIVFGIGGVGGAAAEALARAGVGTLALVDRDVVDETNLNRQIIALHSTLGRPKVDVLAERIRDIDPGTDVRPIQCFFLPDTADGFDFAAYDYVVDAVDNVTAKLELAVRARSAETPVISSMGTGNRLTAGNFRIADISETHGCPLAKVMRKELRDRGIERLKVVFAPDSTQKSRPPGSISFVPPVAGLLMAGEVVRDLLKQGGFQHD